MKLIIILVIYMRFDNNSISDLHFSIIRSLSNIWEPKNTMEKFAKYTLIIPIFLGLGAMFTVPWRWVIRNNATSLDPSGADRVRARTNSAARNTLSTHSLKRISRTKKSPFSHVEYPFYNLHPEKPIVDREGKVLEDFQHFQINCNGDTIAYNERFQCFEGPQITRYNPAGTQNAALLSQIQLTPDMAQKLPNLPEEFRERPIGNAFITIWGNLPNLQPEIGGGQHLMFRPETLVGQVPNSYGRLGKGLYPLNIGIFTDPDGGIVSVDRNEEAADLATGLALNDKLKQCRYDCHGENDVPHADPEQSVEDDVYLTSVMGTFDLDETSVHVLTSTF
jgi:hypothetical protein